MEMANANDFSTGYERIIIKWREWDQVNWYCYGMLWIVWTTDGTFVAVVVVFSN